MIRRIREMLLSLTSMLIAIVALSSFLIASYELEAWPWGDHRPFRERYVYRTVQRATMAPILSAPGKVESSKRTTIRCQLENITGGSARTSSASTVLWLIPEGSVVKSGEVLAQLDKSGFEEMFRQQAILVEQAKASHLQAQLNHEIALLAVKEYMEGTVPETVQQMEGNLALARADVSRAAERLDWTTKMNQKGYASIAQIVTDKQTVTTSELALQRQVGSYELFMRFTLPKTQKTLEGDVQAALTSLHNEQVRLQRQFERYETLKNQVEYCTIRAPQEGVVYYHQPRPGRGGPNSVDQAIEEGMSVRQKQELFYLPDLSDMEVQVALNESIVARISPGLRATVRFEALPDLVLEGEVTTINQIPLPQDRDGGDVHNFISVVKLDRSAPGLKPNMSAQVYIRLPQREGVLAVPHEAVVTDEKQNVCYLPREDHLERREVSVGGGTSELIEITGGLSEGDEVVLNPPVRGGRPRSLSGFDDSTPWPAVDFSKVAAAPKFGNRDAESSADPTERRKGRRTPGDPTRKGRGRAAKKIDPALE
jgi:HlyD family secretion protein